LQRKQGKNSAGKVCARKKSYGGRGCSQNDNLKNESKTWPAPLSNFQYLSSIKSLILALSIQSLVQKNPSNQSHELGIDPSRGRILCLHVRYSNRNILSFWYWNQMIQKPKFIYVSRTTTLMKESKWDKIILQNRI
jgi:hypothetical protein